MLVLAFTLKYYVSYIHFYCTLIQSHNSQLLQALTCYACHQTCSFTNVSKHNGADRTRIYGHDQLDILILPAHGEALPAHQLLAS